MEYVGNLVVRISADMSAFSTSMAAVETKLGASSAKMAAIGGKLTKGVTLPIVALGAASVFAFANFDEAMTSSLAIMGDVSDAMRTDMADAARDVGKTTSFSATQAAEAYFFLASAGLTAEQSIAALPKVAAFAQAGNFDLAQATDLLTDAQSALGLSSDDTAQHMENMTRVSDVLVKANTLANASVEQFSEALTSKLGASLRNLNKPIEEGVAWLAVLADQGIKGATAGEGLARWLEEMGSKALTSADAFKKHGIAVYDSTGNMRGMTDIVKDVEIATAGMSDEQKKATFLELGLQKQTMATMLSMVGGTEAAQKYGEGLGVAGGITQSVADKQMESFKNQMGLVKDKLVDAGISIGEVLAPKLKTLAEWVAKVAEKFSNLPAGVQTAIIVFGGLLAAIGPIMSIGARIGSLFGGISKIIGGVGAAITTMQTTSMASLAAMEVGFAASFAAIAIAIGAAIVVVNHFKKAADEARKEAEKAIDESAWNTWAAAVTVELKTTLGITGAQAGAIRTGVLEKFADLPAGATQTFTEMRDAIAARLYETTGITGEEAAAQASNLINKWTDIKNEGGTTFAGAREAIVAQLQQLGVESAEKAGVMADGILAQTTHINKDGVLSFEGTRTEIGAILTSLGITSQAQVDTMSAGLLTTMSGLKTNATTTFSSMKGSVVGVMDSLKIEGTQKASLFASETVAEFNTAKTQGGDAVAKLKQSIISDMDILFGVSGEKASAAADAIIANLERGGAEGAQEITDLGTDISTTIGGFNMTTPPITTTVYWPSVDNALAAIRDRVANAKIGATITAALNWHGGGLILHGGGPIPSFATGGAMRSNERIAKVERGEFVMQESAVQKLGLPFMESVNKGKAPLEGGGDTIIQLYGDQVFPNVRDGRDYESFQNEQTRRAVHEARVKL